MSKIVELREVSAETLWSILELDVKESQRKFVYSNAHSIAEAHYSEKAWYRAIYAGDQPVGFVMLCLDQETPEYYLWRFMIDQCFQGQGFGNQAMKQVISFVQSQPDAQELVTSCVPGNGSPIPFYRKLGFMETDQWMGNERVLKLNLK
jgi:diamine N-acetyltransferase